MEGVPMTEKNKGIGRSSAAGALGERNPGAAEEAMIPDYVMLDFADDFFPDEAANTKLSKPYVPPELFGLAAMTKRFGRD
jgi:hypothetical protein